jgi:RNA polymerase sigma factor (sigma-70 family)
MPEETSFRDLIRRVRARDEQAAAELVRRYEGAIRVAVRVRLTDPRLRRLLDSMDICQSVLANFFVRAASGQFELDSPEQLLKLLTTMARNRLANEARKYRTARRDQGRTRAGVLGEDEVVDRSPDPGQVVANREVLEAFRGRLSAEECRLVDQRGAGRSWVELAAELGESPDAVRVRVTRAIDRAARELGLE